MPIRQHSRDEHVKLLVPTDPAPMGGYSPGVVWLGFVTLVTVSVHHMSELVFSRGPAPGHLATGAQVVTVFHLLSRPPMSALGAMIAS